MTDLRDVEVIENIFIPLSSGVVLAARVWRPVDADENPVPAILEYIPYRKRDFTRARDESMHPWFAARGYACIRVDIRGSGESSGVLLDEYLPSELDDGAEIIAWLAAQPWCTGNVGMMGKSWGAYNALQVAALKPPALKAIIPVMGTDHRYLECIHYTGGALMLDNFWWGSIMHAFNARPPDPELVGDAWRDMWMERLEANDYWSIEWLRHLHWDAFWQHGSVSVDPNAVECPVWFWGGWADLFRDTPFRLAQTLQAPFRLTMGPWAHLYPHEGAPGPQVDFCAEALRWWDHWLKGIDNGVMNEPPLQFFQSDGSVPSKYIAERPGQWVSEAALPSPNITPLDLYLSPGKLEPWPGDGTLVLGPRQKVAWAGGDWCGFGVDGDIPGDQKLDDGDSLVFVGAPLEDDLDILGNPTLTLGLIADATSGNLSARLIDVAPDGSEYMVSRGISNLAQTPERDAKVDLVPGQPFRRTIDLTGISHRFLAGHRIKVALSNGYWPIIWPAPGKASFTIDCADSCLNLPKRTFGANDPLPPPPAPPKLEKKRSTTRSVEKGSVMRDIHIDQITGQVTHRAYSDGGVFGPVGHLLVEPIDLITHHVTDRIFRIHPDDPLSAHYEMRQTYEFKRGDWQVRVEVHDEVTCDETHFHVKSSVEAFEKNVVVHRKEWNEAIPR